MLPRGAAVLAAAALRAHAVAAVSLRASPIGPSDEPFDDFYAPDPYRYDDQGQPSESPVGHNDRRASLWEPVPRQGEIPLRGPQGPNNKTRWDNRMLIVPSKKFAFCYIEKNACTQFNRMINAMNGMNPHDATPFWKSNSDSKERRFRRHFENNSISRENGWKMAIFLRDPAERFLSAWLSKCDAWEHEGIDCLGPKVTDLPDEKKVELFEKTVLELLPKYMSFVHRIGYFNAHFDPQHVFCGGRNIQEYDFVGKLSGSPEYIQKQVVNMMRLAGMEEWEYLIDLPRKLFPSSRKAGHVTGSTTLMSKFYRNRTIYNKVVELYGEDYCWASSNLHPSSSFPGFVKGC